MTGWLTPTPEGERVLLRPPATGDEPALIEMATDPEVRRYIDGPVDPDTARAAQKTATPVWGQFVIVDRISGDVTGSGSLARKRGPWEISYQLRRPYWGRGFAGEAVTLVRDWFFAETDENLLIATTQLANTRSRRLLERAAATLVKEFEQYGLPQGWYEFRR